MARFSLEKLNVQITECARCPRLRAHCKEVARVKRRAYLNQVYWGKPVPGFGDPKARIWIVGLAPGAHGANRTGRMFTGDRSGEWLYGALHRAGFANQAESTALSDGLSLTDVYISAAARCAPPDNKPLPEEIRNCERFLDAECVELENVKVLLALGKIALDSVVGILKRNGTALPHRLPKFRHGLEFQAGPYTVMASYHPSQQNTQTGRLTASMWNAIFQRCRSLLESH